MKTILITSLMSCCLYFQGIAENYYLSASGNDSASGISAATAWKTIQKLNTIQLHPGDSVLFEGGSVFSGTIVLEADDAGTQTQPVFIGSYGAGRAVIQAGSGFGIRAYNCAGVHIAGLNIVGDGVQNNTADGIEFYMDSPADLNYVLIEQVDASGFRDYGIQFGAWNTNNGFRNVQVRYVNCFNNGNGGMMAFGYNTVLNHKDFYVGYSTFHDNKGRTDITNTNTGSGIVLSGIEGAMIEYCEAYNNGENNSNPTGGPVGIWFYLVKNGIIQFCESHHNRTGTADGGGFDLDGGSQNCIIQYCYSHDNAGPGYLLAEYGSGRPFTGNIIRYNISQNDARKSSAGAITFWGADASNAVRQSIVHNNTVFINDANVQSGIPAAVRLIDNNFSGAKLCNNIFYTSGNVQMLNADTNTDSTQLHFLGNDYYAVNGNPVFHWVGTQINSLAGWKAAAATQERRGSIFYGISADPLLAGAGSGNTIGVDQLQQMPMLLGAYKLGINSQAVDAGIDMIAAFGSALGGRDFFGNAPEYGAMQDAGAHECADCYSILPGNKIQLTARQAQGHITLSWQMKDEKTIRNYTVQYSRDGRNFSLLQSVIPDGRNLYSVTDSSEAEPIKYFRLLVTLRNGSAVYSNIVKIRNEESAFDVRFIGNRVIIHSPIQQQVQFLLFNSSGQLISHDTGIVPQGIYYYNREFRQGGRIFLLKVINQAGECRTVHVFG